MKSKKNIKGIIIIAILVTISMFFINMSFASNTGKINVETANLRGEANADSKILEQLSINEEVEILEKSGEWYKVRYNKITGFIRQDLITTNEEQTVTEADNTANESTQTENVEVANTTIEPEQTSTEQEEIKVGETYQIKEDTKLKIVPSINATNIIEVKKDESIIVTEIINGWACIETEATKGWIRQEKLKSKEAEAKPQEQEQRQEETQTEPKKEEVAQVVQEKLLKTQYIKSSTVNLRAEPNTTSNVVAMVAINTPVEVYAEENGWSKVKIKSIAKEGYISSSLLSDVKQETSRGAQSSRTQTTVTQNNQTTESTQKTTTSTQTQTATTKSNIGASVVETAKKYIGCKYVYGGSTPSGFDCSGFTSYVYKQHGVTLNRTAAGQYSNGTAVSKSELQPGDLVMFGKSGINHVGIYMGGGQIVHAANSSRGVTTDTINSGYYAENYVGARRIK